MSKVIGLKATLNCYVGKGKPTLPDTDSGLSKLLTDLGNALLHAISNEPCFRTTLNETYEEVFKPDLLSFGPAIGYYLCNVQKAYFTGMERQPTAHDKFMEAYAQVKADFQNVIFLQKHKQLGQLGTELVNSISLFPAASEQLLESYNKVKQDLCNNGGI